jgi:hydrogenase maturation protease
MLRGKNQEGNTFLVVGYGNRLRGDDGIGPEVADRVELWNLPQVRSISAHQLTPELAEELSRVDGAIFVDACIDSEVVRVCPLLPKTQLDRQLGHDIDPRSLLCLAQILYGNVPQTWFIAVPGTNFELGESLSKTAQNGVDQALATIRKLLVLEANPSTGNI